MMNSTSTRPVSSYSERIDRISVSTEATIRDLLAAINAGGLGVCLVFDAETERHFRVIADGDIRRALLSGMDMETPQSMLGDTAGVAARYDAEPAEIASMFNETIRVIPILDEDGKVVDLAVHDPRFHLPVAEPALADKELEYVTECLVTGWISSGGPFVTRFEEAFGVYCGVEHAVAVSNGTAALHLALAALDIGPGDEVIVPSFTFVAPANAAVYVGARPVFVDVSDSTWTLDPDALRAAITERTRAIIPVHLYGHPADMDPILEVAARHDIAVIEDAAEAHGARYRGRPVGSMGRLGTYSFFANKVVTTGEGGMVVTDDGEIAERLRTLRDHGMAKDRKYWHEVVGFNYRLTNLQAAIGVAQLEKIGSILEHRDEIAARYRDGLAEVPGIELQPVADWADPICWLFTFMIDPDVFGMDRDSLIKALRYRGIESRVTFPPMHIQPAHRTDQTLPVSERLAERGISLPTSVTMSFDDIDRIVDEVTILSRR